MTCCDIMLRLMAMGNRGDAAMLQDDAQHNEGCRRADADCCSCIGGPAAAVAEGRLLRAARRGAAGQSRQLIEGRESQSRTKQFDTLVLGTGWLRTSWASLQCTCACMCAECLCCQLSSSGVLCSWA